MSCLLCIKGCYELSGEIALISNHYFSINITMNVITINIIIIFIIAITVIIINSTIIIIIINIVVVTVTNPRI